MCHTDKAKLKMKETETDMILPETAGDGELARQTLCLLQPSRRNLTQEEKDLMWMNVQKRCADGKTARRRRIIWISSAAAACIALATVLSGLYFRTSEKQKTVAGNAMENTVRPDTDGNDIQIILADNEKIVLKEQTAEIIHNRSGEIITGSETDVLPENNDAPPKKSGKQTAYNQVIVPKGKRSTLTLSDGSKLFLNACSRIVYPAVFAGNRREIYIEGEVYAQVKPDVKRPFILKTRQIEIQVTGTSFNVTAYDGAASQEVVLVEGSVSVKVKGKSREKTALHPGQMFSLTGEEATVRTVDATGYISWKDGYFLSKYDKLSLILNRLSHYYGIDIRYGTEVGEMKFTGKLDLKDDPDRVMFGLQNAASVECRKENDTYIINPLK
jgi:ferric-dicitrate binding protein FerR (iron transport regulator)